MQSTQIVPGRIYGYRRSPRSREAPTRIEALEKVARGRGRWRVKFLDDPYPGLVDYVRASSIIAPWKKIPALLRFERKLDQLLEVSSREWPGSENPLAEAVNDVLEATGEDLYLRNDGLLEGDPAAMARVAGRAGVEAKTLETLAARDGRVLVPFPDAVRLAVAFAAAEPGTVHSHLDLLQRQYEADLKEPGRSYMEPLVNRWRAAWAVARQWAGRNAELEARDREIQRLRDIISRHLVDLRRHCPNCGGPAGLADKLERALRGR